MNENYLSELELLLSKNQNYVVEGTVNKNKVAELAHKYDAELIDLLAGNEAMRKLFFVEAQKDLLMFNKDKFIQFISNKEFLPDSFTAYKNKIGLATGTELLSEKKDVVLNWPYKDCVLEGGQDKEDAKRSEVFHNEVLAPDKIDRLLDEKVLTGWKLYDKDGEHEVKDFNDADNLIIRGNNLLALHSLKRRYVGKVKLIYIDPPYNTDEDEFQYNDSFSHSTWLTFMRNRLNVAWEFLRPDGFIAIQVNDIEYAYLRVLCDELFGRERFQASICVKMAHLSGPKMAHKDKKIPKVKEYILIYSKTESGVRINPEYVPVSWDEAFDRYQNFIDKSASPDDYTKWQIMSLNEAYKLHDVDINDNASILAFNMKFADCIFQTAINRSKDYPAEPRGQLLYIGNRYVLNGREVIFASEKIRRFDGKDMPSSIISDIWTDIGINNVFQEGGKEISLRFGKKPEALLKRIVALLSNDDDIVMDFFLGTGTTLAVAHKMRRQYVGIEQLDYGPSDPVNRMKNVLDGDKSGISSEVNWTGGGSFVYAQLMDLGNRFVQAVKNADTDKELTELLEQARKSSFLSYKVDPEKINPGDKDFSSLSIAHKKQLLLEIVDHNHLYVNYTEIDDKDYGVSAEDKKLNKKFYEN